MAQSSDLFLDILTKEEKEALLTKKMEEIRRKNEALRKRHEEIEADKRLAEKKGMAIPPKAATSTPVPPPPQPSHTSSNRREPRGDGEKSSSKFAAGRGKRLANMTKEKLKAPDYEKRKPGGLGAKNNAGHGSKAAQEAKSPTTDGPPPDPTFNFLADRSREGPATSEGRRETKRHPRNFGGQSISDIKSRIKVDREKQGRHYGGPPQSKREMEIKMTGRERREYMEWKAERDKIDRERIDRQKRQSGDWKREWDREKDEFIQPPSPPSPRRTEPGRRPAGRIGSGRFALGEQGGSDMPDKPAQSGFHDSHDTRTFRGSDMPDKPAQSGFHDSHDTRTFRGRDNQNRQDNADNRHQFSSTPRRGRGGKGSRGGRGSHHERPPRLRMSSSGSEDGSRSVEKQNDSLMIKIDNDLASPTSIPAETRRLRGGKSMRGKVGQSRGAGGGSGRIRPPRSPGSSPGATKNGGKDSGVINIPVTTSTWKPNPEAAEFKFTATAGTTWTTTTASSAQPWVPGPLPEGTPGMETVTYEGDHEGQGDDDEWEDAEDSAEFYKFTEVEGEYVDEEDLHNSSAESLERFIQEHTLRLNSDSTSVSVKQKQQQQFTPTSPTSPGVIKTPEGHVKVLDWAAAVEENSPKSPSSSAQAEVKKLDLSVSSDLESSSGMSPEKRRGEETDSVVHEQESTLPEMQDQDSTADKEEFLETKNTTDAFEEDESEEQYTELVEEPQEMMESAEDELLEEEDLIEAEQEYIEDILQDEGETSVARESDPRYTDELKKNDDKTGHQESSESQENQKSTDTKISDNLDEVMQVQEQPDKSENSTETHPSKDNSLQSLPSETSPTVPTEQHQDTGSDVAPNDQDEKNEYIQSASQGAATSSTETDSQMAKPSLEASGEDKETGSSVSGSGLDGSDAQATVSDKE